MERKNQKDSLEEERKNPKFYFQLELGLHCFGNNVFVSPTEKAVVSLLGRQLLALGVMTIN